METASNRLDAVNTLIRTLRNRYPEKGFTISPKLDFVQTTTKGLCIRAKQPIKKDETLMVLPEAARLGSKIILGDSKKIRKLHRDILDNGRKYEQVQRYLSPEDYLLAISIMKMLAMKCQGQTGRTGAYAVTVDQAATWPSEAEMQQDSWYYWDAEKVKDIWNQSGLWFTFEELQNHVKFTFDNVLYPFFKKNQPEDYVDTTLPSNVSSVDDNKKSLWNTFIYSLSLGWSRSHGGESDCPELIPLVELFNGHSDRIDQTIKKSKKEKSVINVAIATGFWPFIGGGRFINECNLECSSVYATGDIDQGEEVIISYGEASPTGFVAKYGSLPPDFLHHFNILSDCSMWTPPQFIPTEEMRIKCLERSGYPLDILKKGEGCTALGNFQHQRDDIERYRHGYYEPDVIKSMRQYLILAVLADDFELNRNYNSGRLRGPLYESRVMPLLCQMVDYNIQQLTKDGETTTSAEDVERATSENVPSWEKSCLLARVAYRESLLMWRHAFDQRRKDAMNFEEHSNMDDSNIVGCNVCGRSYPAKKCSRCQKVQYCSKGHQQLDWKSHKTVCRK